MQTPIEKLAIVVFLTALLVAIAALGVRITHENTPPHAPKAVPGTDLVNRLKGQRVLSKADAPDMLIVWVVDVRSCNACAKVETMAAHWSNVGGAKKVLLLGEPSENVMKHLANLSVQNIAPSPILEEIARSQSFALLIDGVFVSFHMLTPEGIN